MTEVVLAVYGTARAAETAIADLQTARVPTAKIVSDPAARAGFVESCKLGRPAGNNVVAVTGQPGPGHSRDAGPYHHD